MQIKISRDHFANALKMAAGIITESSPMPALKHVLLKTVGKNAIGIACTNLDIWIECAVPAEVVEAGSILLPAKRLLSIVAELPAAEIEIEALKSSVKITSGAARFGIFSLEPKEMPPIPAVKSGTQVKLNQDILDTILRRIVHAQSRDETRYILNSVFLSIEKNQLVGVATDGRRLAISETDIEEHASEASAIIVPSKTIKEVLSCLGYGSKVWLRHHDKKVVFELETDKAKEGAFDGPIRITSKLVDGKYPNYHTAIPKNDGYRPLKLEREIFAGMIHRTSLVCSPKNNVIKLSIEEGKLNLSAKSSEVGNASETVAALFEGKPTIFNANPAYLLEPLHALTEDAVELRVHPEGGAAVLLAGTTYREVIMPIKTE